MWQCRKCGKPVYFAERKQSLGFDWHPKCLRCEECGKRLNPGQHAEHKGVPYCHHPCYGALFGPQLFGHGTRNECHTSFGKVENRDGQVKRSHLEARLKAYNQYYEGKPGELKSREANGRVILEGVLKIYWGVRNVIHLKEEDDQRTIAVRRRSGVNPEAFYPDSDDEDSFLWRDESPNGWRTPQSPGTPVISKGTTFARSNSDRSSSGMDNSGSSSPVILNTCSPEDEGVGSLKGTGHTEGRDSASCSAVVSESNSKDSEGKPVKSPSSEDVNGAKNSQVPSTPLGKEAVSEPDGSNDLPSPRNGLTPSKEGGDSSVPEVKEATDLNASSDSQTPSKKTPVKTGSTAIRRRPGRRMDKTKLKRRCSINGHFYLRETSSFTPPHGSPCSVWVTSLITTEEVLNMLLEKYRVEMSSRNFALFVIKDNGERRRIRDDEYPLITRVMLGPHEEVARFFIVDAHQTDEISPQVAQFLNLSLAECRAILLQYEQEEMRNIIAVRQKYESMAFYIQRRMKELRGV
ncbi:ras association domain-containing protein 4-like [Penaeus japonicus]|uniref:ras association domain-containing protein 4-like n=1 Tax=Penaeus japonicus TaxID=27405 RepID=UPI001C716764|nr:ras association domain-containing protein 4-like [Penaeus japonicus]